MGIKWGQWRPEARSVQKRRFDAATFRRFNSARNNESLDATLMAPVRVGGPFQLSQYQEA